MLVSSLASFRVRKDEKDRLKNVVENEIKMTTRVIKREVCNTANLLDKIAQITVNQDIKMKGVCKVMDHQEMQLKQINQKVRNQNSKIQALLAKLDPNYQAPPEQQPAQEDPAPLEEVELKQEGPQFQIRNSPFYQKKIYQRKLTDPIFSRNYQLLSKMKTE